MGRSGLNRREAESLLLAVLVAAVALTMLVVQDKLAFLSFFQLPVLIAAYFLGRRQGVLVAVTAVLMVGLYVVISPDVFAQPSDASPYTAVFIWGAFMVVTAYVVGTLYEAKRSAVADLRNAYAGVIDILSELIDAVDQYAENHSVRVSELGARIGVVLDLDNAEIENVRVAGLLHDIERAEVSIDVLRKAAHADADSSAGGPVTKRLSQTGGLLRDVIPIVEAYAENFDGSGPGGVAGTDIPLGARILAAADELDQLTAPEPYGGGLSPSEALLRIEKHSGTRFDPRVIDALIKAVEAES